jgi:hypothetical protein
MDERSWATGVSGDATDEILRAKQMKSITAWRSFEQEAPNRWLWAEVIPFSSVEGAENAAFTVGEQLFSNARAKSKLVSEHLVDCEHLKIPEMKWDFEQATSSSMGPGMAIYLSGAVNSMAFVIGASGLEASWTFEELARIFNIQARKIADSVES